MNVGLLLTHCLAQKSSNNLVLMIFSPVLQTVITGEMLFVEFGDETM